MDTVCVFCGSSPGNDPAFLAAARSLARTLAAREMTLVYGGARVGLMGALADEALAAGARVIGVLPRALVDWEVAHPGLTELRVVESMHQRKALMAELAGGFVALPGGLGTLEELFEVWTWSQLGLHGKPLGLLDVGGFFAPLLSLVDRMVEAGFLRREHREVLAVEQEPGALLDLLARARPRVLPKWQGTSWTDET
jgi:uncharacterized protein (TIGR00730 family)